MFAKATLSVAASIAFSLLTSSFPTHAQAAPSSPGQAKSHRMPVPRKFSYRCDGGTALKVALRENHARVVFKDKSYAMTQVESGSGVRYAEGHIVWWSKGSEGFLEDETDPDHPVKLARNCQQVPAKTP